MSADYDDPDQDEDMLNYDSSWDDASEKESDVEDVENSHITKDDCLKAFSTNDFIMEPKVFAYLKRYFQTGGAPEEIVLLLSEKYSAVAQTVNLMAEWLILTGIPATKVQDMVEGHFSDLILKHFDPKKADSIFNVDEGTPEWLVGMISQPKWRDLFYKLAEQHPDCVMLNFTVKLISDAGFQEEIANVSTACQQIDVFLGSVLLTTVKSILSSDEEAMKKQLPEFTKMVCYGEHTFLFTMLILYHLSHDPNHGSVICRIIQELEAAAVTLGHDVAHLTMMLLPGASGYFRACQSLTSMLSKSSLNPADVTVLYKLYTGNNPPPCNLIRQALFLKMLSDSLFSSKSKINPDHKPKYIYLLAYAVSISELWKKNVRRCLNNDDLKKTQIAIEKLHQFICSSSGTCSSNDILINLPMLFDCIGMYPVCSLGIINWVSSIVNTPDFFQLNTDHTPVHLVLLDEIAVYHIHQHQHIFKVLTRMFEASYHSLDVMRDLEVKRMLIDRMIHLISTGYVLPVVTYMTKCSEEGKHDISLTRYFVTELLGLTDPPYSTHFIAAILPIVNNENVTGPLKANSDHDVIGEFLAECEVSVKRHSRKRRI